MMVQSARNSSKNPHSSSTTDHQAVAGALRSSTRRNKTLLDTKLHPNVSVVQVSKPKQSSTLPDRTAKRPRQLDSLQTDKSIAPQSRKRKLDDTIDLASNITNGLQTTAGAERKGSAVALLPQINGTTTHEIAVSEDTRSLRSKAGGTRLKSDLATYFSNFDDIIAGVPQPPG